MAIREEPACFCESTNLTKVKSENEYDYYRCNDCGNSFGVPQKEDA